ncbi:MAG TPA: glycosyl hydrolase [Thermoanaerobaculia bacterium]
MLAVRRPVVLIAASVLLLLARPAPLAAAGESDVAPPVRPELLQGMKWRLIGPFRGGRVTAVTGVRGQPLTFYFGATGGGVWKSEDAGTTWRNVSDGFTKTGTVGAVAVAESDPNVVYAGMGEAAVRGVTTASGDGVYKSTDGGRTWRHLGLEATRHVSRLRVHPKNANIVYVAAQGNLWAPNAERGVYRSLDGGLNWRQVFFVDERTGAGDLAMDATNPRILYAAFWEHQRLPWRVTSGGPGSGLYKTTDAGDSWTELTDGLPELMGKIGVAVSPARPDRVWAIVEADEGGLFRSDDAGKTWRRINSERVLRARAWYYTKVFADPVDPETVWVTNAPLLRSVDGGTTFTRVATPHGDNHDLWLDPDEPRRMINGNDGGANVSMSGGATWSTQANQPTAQLYRVATDARFPYRVYGGQQDNSTVAIASRSPGRGIGREDWHPVGGCESAHVAFDPRSPKLVYAGCYQGLITEYDVETRQERAIMAYPYLGLGTDPKDLTYRFNWNAPVAVSPHDPAVVYHAGNVVLRSRDRGVGWRAISPDLTRDEEDKQGTGGGPITNEAAGAETYNTIFSFVESPHEPGTFWAGTDDGLMHLSRDGGANWTNVTPEGLGAAQVNAIEVSPHDPARAYLAVTYYKFGDFSPHVYRTDDYGVTWTRRVDGIGEEAFVRVVREDPVRAGLLFAGTEAGLYLSLDDGVRWQPFQLNLPVVPITDLTIRDGDLVAATQGRSFWILDDLSPLRQLGDAVAASTAWLFRPREAYRVSWPGGGDGDDEEPATRGENPPDGAVLYYYLAESLFAEPGKEEGEGEEKEEGRDEDEDEETEAEEEGDENAGELVVTLDVLDLAGEVIRSYSSKKEERPKDGRERRGERPDPPLPAAAGLNRFAWDLRRERVTEVPELLTMGGSRYRVAPGTYRVRLTAGSEQIERPLEVRPDPRRPHTPEAFAAQQELSAAIRKRLDEVHAAVNRLAEVRRQVNDLVERARDREWAGAAEIVTAGEALAERIDAWEEKLVQRRHETFQDVINFPPALSSQLLFLLESVDASDPPLTAGARARFTDLDAAWQAQAAEMRAVLDQDLPAFNALFDVHRVPAVIVP